MTDKSWLKCSRLNPESSTTIMLSPSQNNVKKRSQEAIVTVRGGQKGDTL